MNRKQQNIATLLLVLIALALGGELIRSIGRVGDFRGYALAGIQVIKGANLYSSDYNTWPPFFSIVCVPIALINDFSEGGMRFIWLVGSLLAFWGAVRLMVRQLLNRKVSWKTGPDLVSWRDPILLVPLLIILRYLLDNLANVQINMYILFLAILTIYFFIKEKPLLAGIILAFSISIKVYPIFLLIYFVFKREWAISLWTMVFLAMFNGSTVLVFGWEESLGFHETWKEIASNSPAANHKNQSLTGLLFRLLSNQDPGFELQINLLDLSDSTIRKLSYLVAGLAAIVPAYLVRKKLTNRTSLGAWLEYAMVLSALTVLSPLSWKAYFVFLWPSYFLVYLCLYRMKTTMPAKTLSLGRGLLWLSVVLTIASTDGLIGRYLSDVMEMFSAIFFGVVMLLAAQLLIYVNLKHFSIENTLFDWWSKRPNFESDNASMHAETNS